MSLKDLEWSWSSFGNSPGDGFIQWHMDSGDQRVDSDEEYEVYLNGTLVATRDLMFGYVDGTRSVSISFDTNDNIQKGAVEPGDEFWILHEDGTELLYNQVPDAPSLEAEAIIPSSQLADVGESVAMDLEVTNYGNIAGTRDFTIYRTIEVSGSNTQDKVTDVTVSADAGQTVKETFYVTMPGEVNLLDGQYLTVYEGNDSVPSVTITVRVPDMYLVANSGFSDDNVEADEPFNVGYTVGNDGDADGVAIVDVVVDGVAFEENASVDAGSTRDFTQVYSASEIGPGTHVISVEMVDPAGTVIDAGSIQIEEPKTLEDDFYLDYVQVNAQQPTAGDDVEVEFNAINDTDQVVEADARVSVNGDIVHDEFISVLPENNTTPIVTVTAPNSPDMECCVELENKR